VQGAVCPVVVVERFELAQGVQQVDLVQDEVRSSSSARL
jgi:hypothetical protein